jgi:serine/threonine-protein kinase
VDKRTDIFAFGAVLYEMLTGRKAFPGEDVSETLARVIEREPDWSRLPVAADGLVGRLLRRCLEKTRTERLPDIGVARLDIKEALALPATSKIARTPSRNTKAWAVSAAALAVVAGFAGFNLARAERSPLPVTRTAILLNENTRLANLVHPVVGSRMWNTPLALSDDGRTVYFVGEENGQRRIYRRALGQAQAEALRGTEGAELVFLSPDGEWLGFFAERQLKKMRLGGEAPITFYEGRVEYAQWGPDDIVVFEEDEDLWQIDAVGGEPRQITSGAYLETLSLLPGGQAVLAANPSMGGSLVLVPVSTGEPRELTLGVRSTIRVEWPHRVSQGNLSLGDTFRPRPSRSRGERGAGSRGSCGARRTAQLRVESFGIAGLRPSTHRRSRTTARLGGT